MFILYNFQKDKIMETLKYKLYNHCKSFVNKKLQTIENTIKSNQEALGSETKSSAGDKHETGRAMLQLEMEKAGQQLQVVSIMKKTLDRIDLSEQTEVIRLGSVVKTNTENYFIAISTGKIEIENEVFYAISPSSPIGTLLLGKKLNDSIEFRGKRIDIKIIF